nr:MAG TPA: hypothetical protein [Bacteriophage sp.]
MVVLKLLVANSHMTYLRTVLSYRTVVVSLRIQQCLIR